MLRLCSAHCLFGHSGEINHVAIDAGSLTIWRPGSSTSVFSPIPCVDCVAATLVFLIVLQRGPAASMILAIPNLLLLPYPITTVLLLLLLLLSSQHSLWFAISHHELSAASSQHTSVSVVSQRRNINTYICRSIHNVMKYDQSRWIKMINQTFAQVGISIYE